MREDERNEERMKMCNGLRVFIAIAP